MYCFSILSNKLDLKPETSFYYITDIIKRFSIIWTMEMFQPLNGATTLSTTTVRIMTQHKGLMSATQHKDTLPFCWMSLCCASQLLILMPNVIMLSVVIFSTPVLLRHMWQLKAVVFLHWGLIHAVLFLNTKIIISKLLKVFTSMVVWNIFVKFKFDKFTLLKSLYNWYHLVSLVPQKR